MKTYDGAKLYTDRLASYMKKYPEGSISQREILTTLPISGDPEVMISKLNSAITLAIYKSAEAAIKLDKGTKKGFTAVADLQFKTPEDRAKKDAELTNFVMQAVSSLAPTK